jgi:hypothetical protein
MITEPIDRIPAAPWSGSAMTIQEMYEQSIKPLPAPDRLRLATLILNEIPAELVIDDSDEWTDQDLRDITLHSLRRAAKSMEEEVEDEDA